MKPASSAPTPCSDLDASLSEAEHQLLQVLLHSPQLIPKAQRMCSEGMWLINDRVSPERASYVIALAMVQAS